MKTTNVLALVSAALLATVWSTPRATAQPIDQPLVVAQADKDKDGDAKAERKAKRSEEKQQKRAEKPAAQDKPERPPKAAQDKPKQEKKAAQAEQKQEKPERAQAQEQQKSNAEKSSREERRSQRREERREQREERRSQQREERQRDQDQQKPTAQQQKKDQEQKPAARQQQKQEEQQKPAARQQQKQEEQQKPAARQQQKEEQKPTAAEQKQEQQKPAAAQQKQEQQPAAAAQERSAPANSEAAAQEAIKPRSADEFILRKGERRQRGIEDVRRERRETREGDRIIIHEGDRRIVKEDNRIIIRHREAERFAIGARDVNVRRRGGEVTTIVERPNGVRIINVTDEDGHLIRRVRRDPRGREVVIIDNRYRGSRRPDIFINIEPPRFHGHRDRYIVEAWRVPPTRVYEVFTAQPIEPLERHYTLAQVRYSEPLRQYMPRVDLEVHFETGSWQLTPDQIAELAGIAKGLNQAIDKNPDEVFLIEGYTDAVGSEEDNLSLSDRRAEAVAVALTQEFNVPPENLVTQGYGEENLKVETEGPERANRRVSVRRITPLLEKVAGK